MNWHSTVNLFDTILAEAIITEGQIEMVLPAGIAAGLPTLPCILTLTATTSIANLRLAERVRVTAVVGNTLTIARAYDGSSASTWPVNTLVMLLTTAKQFDEIKDNVDLVEFVLGYVIGGGDGVMRGVTANDLSVVARSPAVLSVTINSGAAWVSHKIVRLSAYVYSATVIAPVTNPRIDIVELKLDGTVTIKSGVEDPAPVAPTTDANTLKLAEIYLRVGSTQIFNTDQGAGTGYITDSRVFV